MQIGFLIMIHFYHQASKAHLHREMVTLRPLSPFCVLQQWPKPNPPHLVLPSPNVMQPHLKGRNKSRERIWHAQKLEAVNLVKQTEVLGKFWYKSTVRSIYHCLHDHKFLVCNFPQVNGYESVNTPRSALFFHGHCSELFIRFVKGVCNLRPPLPRYIETWVVQPVLRFSTNHGSGVFYRRAWCDNVCQMQFK